MNEQLSLEIIMNKVRIDIVKAIDEIGRRYSVSSSLLITIVEQIVKDSKIAAYESILNSIDIDKIMPQVPKENFPMEQPIPENFNFETPEDNFEVLPEENKEEEFSDQIEE